MKILYYAILSILLSGMITGNAMAQSEKNDKQTDTLYILWTSGDPDVAIKMVLMYANAAKMNSWFSEVELIVWGPSSKLTAENKEIQETLTSIMNAGVKVEACKACADLYGVSNKLVNLGINVRYMGEPLTEILKSGKKLITF